MFTKGMFRFLWDEFKLLFARDESWVDTAHMYMYNVGNDGLWTLCFDRDGKRYGYLLKGWGTEDLAEAWRICTGFDREEKLWLVYSLEKSGIQPDVCRIE